MSPERTRREFLADAGQLSLAAGLLGSVPLGFTPAAAAAQRIPTPDLPTGGGWSNQDYWAFADWAMNAAEAGFNEQTGYYGSDIRTLCAMLAAHSIAAQLGLPAQARRTRVGRERIPRTQGGPPPLTMTTGPRGRITEGASYPSSPYAGRFSTLEVTGTRSNRGVSIRSTNNFAASRIVSTWEVTRGSNSGALNVDAHFPTYGDGATITAVTKSGRRVKLTRSAGAITLREVAYFFLHSGGDETGYVLVPRRFPSSATTAVAQPAVQSSAPDPGLTLVVKLAIGDRSFRTATLEVAIGIADQAANAASVARSLGAA